MRGLLVAPVVLLLVMPAAPQPARPVPAGTASLGGRVIDRETGEPLADAIVSILKEIGHVELSTLSDHRGEYLFEGIAAGGYRIAATLDGYVAEGSQPPGVREFVVHGETARVIPGSVFVTARAGSRRDIDFALSRAGSIRGRILNHDGTPLEGARVGAAFMTPDGVRFSDATVARSDERGEYLIGSLHAGRYRVSVAWIDPAVKRANARVADAIIYFPGTTNPAEAMSLTVTQGGELRNIDIRRLAPLTFRIGGHVIRGSSEGGIESNLLMPELAIRPVSIGEDGAFELTHLQPGRYTLYARAATVDGFEAGILEAELDSDVTNLVLPLTPAADLRGRVVMTDGTALPRGLQVAANLVGSDDSTIDPTWRDRTDVDEGGRFHLRGLFGHRRLLVLGLPPDLVVDQVRHGKTEVTHFPVRSGEQIDDVTVLVKRRERD